MTSTSSHRRSTIRRSTRRAAAAVTAFAVLVTACGSDDDDDASDDTTAASVAPATDAPADATSTTSPTATDPAPTTDGGAATGTGTAADEEFLELCPADGAPDSVTIAIWGSHPELVEPEMELFTDLTGVDIVWHTDGTADRLIKLNAERGAPTLDLAILPINEIGTLYENGVITAADPRVPNSDVLASVATGIPGG